MWCQAQIKIGKMREKILGIWDGASLLRRRSISLGMLLVRSKRLWDKFVESQQASIWNLGAQRLWAKVDMTRLWQKHFRLENEMAQSHQVQLKDSKLSEGMWTQCDAWKSLETQERSCSLCSDTRNHLEETEWQFELDEIWLNLLNNDSGKWWW